MIKLLKWVVIIIAIVVAFIIYIIMGLGQGNAFVNGKDYNNQVSTQEFCEYVEEIKAHVADYVSVEGGDKHLEFMKLFQTPVERKNRVAHMMYDGIVSGSIEVDSLFDHGYNEFIQNINYYNDLYMTTFPVKECVKNVENRNLGSLVDKFSRG